jgi:hypothetical protein
LDAHDIDGPDWELLSLLREVRRRVRSGKLARLAARAEEPRWLAALPPEEARLARSVLDATRALADRGLASAASAPAPARRKTRRRT